MSNYRRKQVDQWWELHVKGAARDGKSWGPVMDVRVMTPKRYSEEDARNLRDKYYRPGFAKLVKVTRYRVIK